MDPVVVLATSTVSAGPGGEARVQARVRNQGRRVESYALEVVGEPARFCQVEPVNVSVLPGKEADVTITFRPPVGATTPTGSLPFGVRAVSVVGSSSSAVAEGVIELTGATGLQAWADPTTDAGRWSGKYRLQFSNQGNAPARLFVSAHDPSGALRLAVRDEVLTVPPGAQVDTEVRAKARRPFLRGSTLNRVISASCQTLAFGGERPAPGQAPPKDDPNHHTIQLTFQQKPIVSKLALVLGALVVAAVVAFAVLQLSRDKQPELRTAPPEAPRAIVVESFDSTTMSLSWSAVPTATGFHLRTTNESGEESGPPVEELPASTLRHVVTGLAPGTRNCFSVQSTGPEGEPNSEVTQPPACATTLAATTVPAPTAFTATQAGATTFALAWQHAAPEGLTFTVFVDSAPTKPGIEGVTTTIELEPREESYELAVKAFDASGASSDFSERQLVSVPVEASAVETTVAVGIPPVGVPGESPATTAGAGATTTTSGGGPTTTSPNATTTTTSPPAQNSIQDRPGQWAAVFVGSPIQEQPIGPGAADVQRRLSQDFGIPIEQLVMVSNRDTIGLTTDETPEPRLENAQPSIAFFFAPQPDEATAISVCGRDPAAATTTTSSNTRGTARCAPLFLEGSAEAAEGETVLELDRRPGTAALGDVDDLLDGLRTDNARRAIHVLDGADRQQQFEAGELVVFASGFADAAAIDQFCRDNGINPCSKLDLLVEP